MNWDHVEGHWKLFRAAVREEWNRLTDADLDDIAGKQQRLRERLHERYGWARELVEERVDAFWKRLETMQPTS